MNEINLKATVSSPVTQQSEARTESDAFLSKAVFRDDALREYRWRQYVDKCLAEAEAEFQAGVPTIPADDIIAKARKRIANYKSENI